MLGRVDPFAKKDWYDIKAPSVFSVRNIGNTLVSRTQGTKVYYSHSYILFIMLDLFLSRLVSLQWLKDVKQLKAHISQARNKREILLVSIKFLITNKELYKSRERLRAYDVLLGNIVLVLLLMMIFLATQIASEGLKHRVFEVCLADLQNDEDQAHRKIRLRAEDVQGKNVLTNFWVCALCCCP
ncbi:hypothetical protein GW17_00025662 [Ensete ventricosum]|nr:hypothetical protein GW17_00025662 [Ensete ventricosum]